MSILATAHPAKPARTKEAQRIAWAYVILLVFMALTQLVTFSKFVLVIDSYWLPGGLRLASFLAGFIIGAELLSLAFLLRLKLSIGFRVFTMVLSWLVPLIWFYLTLTTLVTTTALTNVGFLGSLIDLVPGWWAVTVSLALAIMAAWATWGLWPFATRKKAV